MSDPLPIPLLDGDLNTMETGLVLLPGDLYDLVVKESSIEDGSDPTKAKRWSLRLATTMPCKSAPNKEGKTQDLAPGDGIVFSGCQLAPTGKSTWKIVAGNIADIVQAVRPRLDLGAFGANAGEQISNLPNWHKQTEGRIVRVRVAVRPPRDDTATGRHYNASNEVSEWHKS